MPTYLIEYYSDTLKDWNPVHGTINVAGALYKGETPQDAIDAYLEKYPQFQQPGAQYRATVIPPTENAGGRYEYVVPEPERRWGLYARSDGTDRPWVKLGVRTGDDGAAALAAWVERRESSTYRTIYDREFELREVNGDAVHRAVVKGKLGRHPKAKPRRWTVEFKGSHSMPWTNPGSRQRPTVIEAKTGDEAIDEWLKDWGAGSGPPIGWKYRATCGEEVVERTIEGPHKWEVKDHLSGTPAFQVALTEGAALADVALSNRAHKLMLGRVTLEPVSARDGETVAVRRVTSQELRDLAQACTSAANAIDRAEVAR